MIDGKVTSGEITCDYYRVNPTGLEARTLEVPDGGIPVAHMYMGDRNAWNLPKTYGIRSIRLNKSVIISLVNGATTTVEAYSTLSEVEPWTSSDVALTAVSASTGAATMRKQRL